MNHKHRKVLHAIFAHPEPANLSPHDVNSVFTELGGEIEERHGDKYAVSLKGHTAVFHHGHHSIDKPGVRQVRKFLEDCGVDPERDFPL